MLYGPPRRLDALVIFTALAILSRMGRRNDVGGRIALSLLSVVLLGAVPIVGPVGAALVGVVASLPQAGRLPRRALAFNSGMYTCMGVIGGLVYRAMGGSAHPGTLQHPVQIITGLGLPLIAADVVQCVTNAVLVAGVVHLSSGVPVRAQVARLLAGTGASYVAHGVIALLLVILWVPAGVGPFSALLIFAPLLTARWALTQYGAETEAHERTLGALVAAVEARTPGSAEQSAAVAELSRWIAEQLTLPPRQVEAASTAGMLHDVGLLTVPAEMLAPGHTLTETELAVLRTHAARSSELLRGISFLEPSIPGVVHHHERWDGSGYPAGLTGEEIPLLARIVAVADGFSALSGARRDRAALEPQEALAVLQGLAGTAYDPTVVQALARALTRHARPPAPAVPLALLGSAVAHDEPATLGAGVPAIRPAGVPAGVPERP